MALSPVPGSYCRVYFASDGSGTISDVAMSEVDLSSQGYPRYSVFEIPSATYRYLNPDEVPVFQRQVHGSGDWETLNPANIEYCGGRIYLQSPINSDDNVRCHSGKYYTLTELLGAATMSFTETVESQEITCLHDSFVSRYPTVDSWNASLDVFWARKCAEYTTSGGNANSHIRFWHYPGGEAGNDITITLSDPGSNNQPLSIEVSGTDVTVSLATDEDGDIVSTASEVAAAINASAECRTIGLMAHTKAGESGDGVVSAMTSQSLVGGLDAQNFVELKGSRLVFVFYDVYEDDRRHEGYGMIEEVSWTGGPKDVVKMSIRVSSMFERLQKR